MLAANKIDLASAGVKFDMQRMIARCSKLLHECVVFPWYLSPISQAVKNAISARGGEGVREMGRLRDHWPV